MPLASTRSSTESKAALDRRRLSLPATIDSSTRVTTRSKRAIDRRRASLKRSNSGNSKSNKRPLEDPSSPQHKGNAVDKENNAGAASPGVTPYWMVAQERGDSPRLTRSASKKSKRAKRPPIATASTATKNEHEDYGPNGVLLNFSPPDHEANARREREEQERKLRERALRIQKAKERGRLLVFSPSNHSTTDSRSLSPPTRLQPFGQHEDHDDDQKLSPTNSATSTMTSQSRHRVLSSSSFAEATLSEHHEQVACELKSLREGVDQLLATREQAEAAVAAAVEKERRRADQSMLEAQMARSEGLVLANAQLEDANQSLHQRLQELQRTTDQAKELLVIERTRLEAEVQTTQRESSVRIQGLEESRQQLESQVTTLQQQKAILARQVSDLETEVKVAREKLEHAKTLLETVRSTSSLEKETLQRELQKLKEVNTQLTNELRVANEVRDSLQSKLSRCEEDLDNVQNQLLPESEDQLQEALSKLQEQTAATARAESHLQSSQTKIKHLQQEVVTLREGMEQERVNFQQLNEDSAVAFEKMKKQAIAKDEKIQELLGRVEALQNDLDNECQSSQKCNDQFSQWKQDMERRTSELDQALAETVSQLETAEAKEKEASCKLESTLGRLEVEVHAKEEALANSQSKEATVEHLEELCRRLEAEAREQNRRAKELQRQFEAAATERDLARQRVEHHDMREEELFRKLMENERVRRDLHNRVMQLSGNIRVFVRVRPPLATEVKQPSLLSSNKPNISWKDRNSGVVARRKSSMTPASMVDQDDESVSPFHFPGIYDRDDDSKSSATTSVACHGTDDILKNLVEVTEPYKDRGGLSDRRKKWRFGFDHVFTPQQGQDDVWKATEPLVQSAIDGYNVTIFAFGQTGSGKTYTLLGEPGNEGLISRSISKLFEAKQDIAELSRGETTVEISVELLEIYNEQVRDLLAPNGGPNGLELALKVTSNEVVGNERLSVTSEAQVSRILEMAQKRRCVKATLSNAESSRSHMLFTIHFHVRNKEGMQRFGKLNICDLAGSERLSKSGANAFVGGDLLKETQHINKSLSTLSNVIERLQEGSPNVPFRESKLTFLLQNSLGGNSKTLAIVCCNPLGSHFHESLCSLRFAAKVSKIDLKAVANFSC